MGIIHRVAGITVLRGGLEIRTVAGIDVALRARDLSMFPDQLESLFIVVEFVTIGVHTIMAS